MSSTDETFQISWRTSSSLASPPCRAANFGCWQTSLLLALSLDRPNILSNCRFLPRHSHTIATNARGRSRHQLHIDHPDTLSHSRPTRTSHTPTIGIFGEATTRRTLHQKARAKLIVFSKVESTFHRPLSLSSSHLRPHLRPHRAACHALGCDPWRRLKPPVRTHPCLLIHSHGRSRRWMLDSSLHLCPA